MQDANIVPRHKDDHEAVENLKKATIYEITPVIKKLLEWLQDGNWPIAQGIAEVLSFYTNSFKNEIIGILQGGDDTWKYWIINGLIFNSKENNIDLDILLELMRIISSPSEGEKEEEIDSLAKETVERWKV